MNTHPLAPRRRYKILRSRVLSLLLPLPATDIFTASFPSPSPVQSWAGYPSTTVPNVCTSAFAVRWATLLSIRPATGGNGREVMYVNRFTLSIASPIHTQNQTSIRATPLPDPTDFLTPPLESERRRRAEVRIGEYSPVQSCAVPSGPAQRTIRLLAVHVSMSPCRAVRAAFCTPQDNNK